MPNVSPRRPSAFIALLALLLVLTASCDGGSDDGDIATPARTVVAGTAVPTASTPGLETDIRDVELASVPEIETVLADTGGSIEQGDVIYDDVTGDEIDEAVVPIASGGTLGNVGVVVLTPDAEGARLLLREVPSDGGVTVDVRDGVLVLVQAVPGPDDPECCPSMLRTTTYEWNGAALAVASVDTAPNPDAGAKGTPGPTSLPGTPSNAGPN
jgi:hypothetical protein